MHPFRIAAVVLAGVLSAGGPMLLSVGAVRAMPASPFDGSHRVVVIAARSADAVAVREQRQDLLQHVAALDERDMVVFTVLPDGTVASVHGPAPTPAQARAFLQRNPVFGVAATGFTVLLVGKDGGVKLRADRPVPAEQLFGLVDTMPMRRQEMKR